VRVRTKFLLLGAWCLGLVLVALAVAWQRRGLGVIEGRVVDADGRPIHAGVWRHPMDWYDFTMTTTAPDGRFALLIPAEKCQLVATHADWSESEPMLVPAGTKRLRGVTLRLRRPAQVSGRVLDPDGRPLVGAVVTCGSGLLIANDTEPSTTTDERGHFAFPVCDVGGAGVSCYSNARSLGGKVTLQLSEGEVVELELECLPFLSVGELPVLPGRYGTAAK